MSNFKRAGFKSASLILLSFLLLYLLHASTEKNKPQQPDSVPQLSAVDAAVNDEMAKQDIVGCAVAVVQNGQLVHASGYGHTSPARTTPITASSVFRWASVSKPLTAVAAFKVIENGSLALTDKVVDKVPYWPSDGDKDDITVAHLLTHRSGINHYGEGQFNPLAYWSSNDFNAEQSVNVFKGAGLLFTPGSQHRYTTFGYGLLGAVIEESSGIPYEQFVLDNIGALAGMTSLTPYSSDPGGWGKNCNGYFDAKSEPSPEWKLPGGGWASNIEDMGRFVNGMMQGTFLRNTSALWNSVSNNSRFCFGVRRDNFNDELYVSHDGKHNDVRTYIGFYPESPSKLGVAVMINGTAESIDVIRLAKRVEEAMGKARNESTLAPMNDCGTNTDCGVKTVGIWRKTNDVTNTIIRRGYNDDDFREEWRWLVSKGYECIDLDTYDDWGRKWGGVFKKTNKRSKIWRNASSEGFLAKWNELIAEGYRLTDIETYMDGNTRKWAGLFTEGNGRQIFHRNMSMALLNEKWEALGAENMRLVDLEYNDGKWVGIWGPGSRNSYCVNFTTDAFREKRLQQRENGRRLIDVETYMVGNQRLWAGVWERSAEQERFAYGKKYCDWLINYHKENLNDGYELIDIESY